MGSIVASEGRQLLTVGMKLAVVWLCILHLAFASAFLNSSTDFSLAHSNVSVHRVQAPKTLRPLSTGSVNQGRKRPLFARRGQYERQRINAKKPKVVPPKGVATSPKAAPKPPKPKCSQLTQSCLPQSGCCVRNTTCHCRFFNAICFCRRINS